MNLFQLLAFVVVAGLFGITLVAMARGWASRREALLWSLLWLAAAVAIVWPGLTIVVAHALGIGRGADLVLYCSVVVMMIGFLMVYARLQRLRRDMTLLVRRLAIRDVIRETAQREAGQSAEPQSRKEQAEPPGLT